MYNQRSDIFVAPMWLNVNTKVETAIHLQK